MPKKRNTQETETMVEGVQEAPVEVTQEEPVQEEQIEETVQEITPEPEAPVEEVKEPETTDEPNVAAPEEAAPAETGPEDIQSPNIKVQIKPVDRSVVGWIKEDFKPSNMGWWTTANDTKRRYNSGVFTNTQSGNFGTLRVCENGMFEFVKHQDWEKRKERIENHVDEFKVICVSENHGLMSQRLIEVEVL